MLLKIKSLENVLLNKENVSLIKLKTDDGFLEILNGHTTTIGTIKNGEIKYKEKNEDKENYFTIYNDGIFIVENDVVSILC